MYTTLSIEKNTFTDHFYLSTTHTQNNIRSKDIAQQCSFHYHSGLSPTYTRHDKPKASKPSKLDLPEYFGTPNKDSQNRGWERFWRPSFRVCDPNWPHSVPCHLHTPPPCALCWVFFVFRTFLIQGPPFRIWVCDAVRACPIEPSAFWPR